jgi:hypothetical protein
MKVYVRIALRKEVVSDKLLYLVKGQCWKLCVVQNGVVFPFMLYKALC